MAEERIKASELKRRPVWLKKRIQPGRSQAVEECIQVHGLHTVCTEAACPNRNECFSKGTAAFMILGSMCTRNCMFCNVASGTPSPPDPDEISNVVQAVLIMGLTHAVITSVTRDDLPDGGSGVFRDLIIALKKEADCSIEVLTPDFQGFQEHIEQVINAKPDVFNHNLETVKRLYPEVRPGASYERSLDLLRQVSRAGLCAKSGIMLGIGETDNEVFDLFDDLLKAGCILLTIGQYLQPNKDCLPVYEYVSPGHFDFLRQKALSMGFKGVSSGPFVRSSHNAHKLYESIRSCEANRKQKGVI